MISFTPPPTRINRVVLVIGIVCLIATFAGAILVTAQKDDSSLPTPAPADQVAPAPDNTESAKTRIAENFGKLPISFEINKGQIDESVKFLAHGTGYDLFLTSTEAVLRVYKPRPLKVDKEPGLTKKTTDADANVREGTVLRLKTLGANPASKAEGQDELPGKVNYFTGNDPEKWYRDIPTYKKVLFKDVYPGIDVVYYGKQRELEYDFVVAPGADPKIIRFTVEGADKTSLDKSGSLRLSLKHGEVSLNKPVIYQVDEKGNRREIKGEYVIKGNEVRFKLEQFDSSKPLIIDPVLSYSTLLGSSSNDSAVGIAVDAQQSAYVTGTTEGTTFPTTAGSFKSTSTRSGAFVTKLNPAGTALVYSTYLTGDSFTTGLGIDVDSAGNAHVIGSTSATDFPIVNGLKTTSNFFRTTDAAANWNNQNSGLAGSVTGVAVAPSAPTTIYACASTGFYRSTDGGTTWTKRLGTGLSSFFVNAVAVDPSNASIVYVGTFSGLSKTTDGGDSWNSVNPSPLGFNSVLSIVFDPSTPATIYLGSSAGVFKSTNSGSTWILQNNFGIPNTPTVRALAIHPSAPLTIYAGTLGNGLFKSTNGGGVWTAMNNGMTGSNATNVNAIVIDPATPATLYAGNGTSSFGGGIHKSVTGGASWTPLTNGVPNAGITAMTATSSGVFAAVGGAGIIKTTNGGTNWTSANAGLWSTSVVSLVRHPSNASTLYAGTTANGSQDAFVTKLNASGSGLLFSTLLGGTREEVGNGIAVDGGGNIVAVGHTSSQNFPVANAFQSTMGNNNCTTAFVTKLNPAVPSYTFSTYLGGSQCGDLATSVATDNSGNVYVTGSTNSSDFPTLNAFQPAFAGQQFSSDAFVTKFTPAGALSYSTYLGGPNGSDTGFGIAVDASGNAYVTGFTSSTSFPTQNPIQGSNGGGFSTDVFVTKLNSLGSALIYSTYLGGTGSDNGRGIAVDSANNAYVTGTTDSGDFPITVGALRTKSAMYKSTDGAANWSNDNFGFGAATASNFGGTSVTGLIVHPTEPSIVYAGSGAGVFKSTNGGRTWSAMNNGLTSRSVIALVIDPATPSTLYAAVSGFNDTRGIYKSIDGGASWNRRVNGLIDSEPLALAIDPDTPNTLYVGISFCCFTGTHIYKTTDGADNWAPVQGASPLVPSSIAVDPHNPSTIYVADAVSPGTVYKGTNGGTGWQNLALPSAGSPARSVVVSPITQGLLYAGTDQGLFRSVNGGTNWTPVPNRSGKVVFDPVSSSTLYLLSNPFNFPSLGLFKSTDNGQTWVPMNKGLNTPQATALAIDPLKPSTLYLASSPVGGQDAFVTKINPAGSALVYSTFLGGPLNPENFSSVSAQAFAIALDSFGNAYVTGLTSSQGFPVTTGSFQPFNRGFNDAFISKLTMSHIISGHVLDGGGAPVSGAEVVVNTGTSLLSVMTESDGSYQFSRLRAGGTYTVSASKPHFTMAPPSQTFANLNSDQVRNFTATATASAFHTISGQITENSVGLSGVTVTLSGSQSGLRTTDSNGNFSFELASGGNYTVTPSTVGFTFGPVNRVFNNLTANQTANFTATRQNFVVTNANNHGAGSLRDAIVNANATIGPDTIVFNIPGSGVKTINLLIALPEITDRVVIDATTQPGYAGTPLIELDGLALGSSNGHGLVIKANNSTVRGLSIGNFRNSHGISVNGSNNNTIQGNYIGVAANGTTARQNLRGIVLNNSSNNVIGGTTAATRNVISGNSATGIEINSGGSANIVQGNFIGTNAAGTEALQNSNGIHIFNEESTNNVIGGIAAGARNLISGNQFGLSTTGTGTTIQGNLIGTDITGTKKIPNSTGIQAIGTDILIGGLTAGARNIISGNSNQGVFVRGTGSKVQGNFIGTDITGALPLGNFGSGVSAGENALIGGTVQEARNIISATSGTGNVVLGQSNAGSPATVQGNYIGTDVTGTRALGGSIAGIHISSSNNVIGGLVAGARNVISGNGVGIQMGGGFFGGTVGNLIQGNFIGLNAAGTGPLPNTNQGIAIFDAANNTIGGTQTGAGNRIAFNGGPGVTISTGTGNSVRRNSIFSNNGLGIDLGSNGVTVNDLNDGDTGANHLQNFPVITGTISSANSMTIQGSLKSIPNTAFQIDFYSNSAVDPSGNGEGAQFINSASVTTNGNGDATINSTFAVGLPAGRVVTATASDPNGNTSEFSAANSTNTIGSVHFSVSSINAIEDVGSLTINVLRTGGLSGNLTVEYATVDGTAVAGQDYTANSGTLTFTGNQTSKTIQIPINNDTTNEPPETFTVVLRQPSNLEALGAPNSLLVTLQDRNTVPTLSISGGLSTEGNAGTTTEALFVIDLSAATGRTVTGNFTTANFTAFGGTTCGDAGIDFERNSGSFTINPGATRFLIPVKICGDNNAEAHENVPVILSNPTGATLFNNVVFGTILDDDELELILEESGPIPNQAAALDSVLGVRDPFRVVGIPDWFPTGVDKNTRVAFFARNLQLDPGESPASVFVRLTSGNFFIEVSAEDVRPIPDSEFTQVVIRLPNNMPPGTHTVLIRAHTRQSNSGTIRIAP